MPAPPNMDVDGAGAGAASGGSGGEIGPVASPVSNMRSSPYTITSAGTTWINTTGTGNVGIDWTCFPWEFPQLFMSNAERVELFNDYLFWKCKSVSVTFKNFRGYVNSVPAAGTDPQTFPTDNAAFQTYIDEMYYLGVQTAPFINESSWIGDTGLMQLMRSWQKGGYDAADRISLPLFDIPVTEAFENIISQNYPNVTQTQGVASESVSHSWHTSGDKYWRCTSEFINGATATSKDSNPAPVAALVFPLTNRLFRCDQFGGIVLAGSNNMKFYRNFFNGIDVSGTTTVNPSGALPPTQYSTYEPIAPLLLRIVPQHIEGNGNSTHLQFDFEIKYHIEVRGKIPRHGYTGANDITAPAGITLAGASESKNRPGCKTAVTPYYPVTQPTAATLLPLNANNIQRGRTKNGFVFIPYTGWETSVRVGAAPAPDVPSLGNTKAGFNDRVHVGVYDDTENVVIDTVRLDRNNQTTYDTATLTTFLLALKTQNLWMVESVRSSNVATLLLNNAYWEGVEIAFGSQIAMTTDPHNHYYFTTTAPPAVTGQPIAPFDPSDAHSLAAYLDSRIFAHINR